MSSIFFTEIAIAVMFRANNAICKNVKPWSVLQSVSESLIANCPYFS
jgi:hypothetical protein